MKIFTIVIITIIAVIALYFAICLIIAFSIQQKIFKNHQEDPKNPCYLRFEDYADVLDRKEFNCGFYGKCIRGYIYSSKVCANQKGFVILTHGFFGTHIQYLVDIAYLCKNGYRVLAFDQYGVGISDGNGPISFSNGIYVLENVIHDVIKKNINNGDDIILYGHSWGAYCTYAALKKYPVIKKAIIRSGFDNPVKITLYLLKTQNKSIYYFIRPLYRICCFFLFGNKNIVKATKYNRRNNTTNCLILHAMDDNMVPYDLSLAKSIEKLNRKNTSYLVKDIGGHNTILQPIATENYNSLVKQYDGIVKQDIDKDEKKRKIEEFISSFSRLDSYPYDEDTINQILSFISSNE